MNLKNVSLVLAIVVLGTGNVFAQTFFWSDLGFGDGAVVDTDFHVNSAVGSSNRLYLYFDAEGVDIGVLGGQIDFDFGWSQDGIVAFVAAETINFDVTIPTFEDFVVGTRWGKIAGPDADLTANDARLFALNVTEIGLVAGNDGSRAFLDNGYDGSASAFLIGSIDYDVLEHGVAGLVLEDSLVVSGDNTIPVNDFSLTIATQIPEPNSASAMALCLVGLIARRRR